MAAKTEDSRVQSVREMARTFQINPMLAYRLVREGRIPHLKLGRRVVIPNVVIDRLLNDPASMKAMLEEG